MVFSLGLMASKRRSPISGVPKRATEPCVTASEVSAKSRRLGQREQGDGNSRFCGPGNGKSAGIFIMLEGTLHQFFGGILWPIWAYSSLAFLGGV